MNNKRDYIKLIRITWILESFTNYYFLRMIVVYLLSKGVTDWVAVSIPVVYACASLLIRSFNKPLKYAVSIDFKWFQVFYQILFLGIGVLISASRSVFLIYPLTIIIGLLTGIRNVTMTHLATYNKEYEASCLIEQERASMIGGIMGLLFSQMIYDHSPKLYIWCYFLLVAISMIVLFFVKSIKKDDLIAEKDSKKELTTKEIKDVKNMGYAYGLLVGVWAIGSSAFEELAPLISDRIGYLNAAFMFTEVVVLFIIGASFLDNLKKKKRLFLTSTVCALGDITALLVAAFTNNIYGLIIAFIITGITSSLGDPVWGSIISTISDESEEKYILVNRSYFKIRVVFQFTALIVCNLCVVGGITSFKILGVILLVLVLCIYNICTYLSKKIYKTKI